LSRPDLFFGVTVSPAFRNSPEALRIERNFRVHLWIHVAITLLIAAVAARFNSAFFMLALVWFIVGSTAALGMAHKAAGPFAASPNPVREASLSTTRDSIPGGWIAALLPIAFLAACGIYASQHWDQIPERFPIHWGINGEPNGWAHRSPASVYGMLAFGAALCLLIAMMNSMIVRSRRISATGDAAHTESRFRRVNAWGLLVTEYVAAITIGGVQLMAMLGNRPTGIPAIWVGITATVFVIVLLTLLFRMGQGGWRLASATNSGAPIGDRTPDSCWKWGFFYVNPDDPAIMVEKRFGIGYTINFGHRIAWVIMAVLLIGPIIVTSLLRH
jgi:uncharacterized membrane protein